MPHMTQRKCQCCDLPFMARTADVNRGWARFCSKSCKATRQVQRGGKYERYQHRMSSGREIDHECHPFSSDALGQE